MQLARPRFYVALAVALFVLLTMGCSTTGDWTRRDTAMELTWQALNAADAYTTNRIQDNPNVVEADALAHAVLGDNPSTGDVAMYFTTRAVSHYLISRYLIPERWRPYWHTVNIGITGSAVINNCELELC